MHDQVMVKGSHDHEVVQQWALVLRGDVEDTMQTVDVFTGKSTLVTRQMWNITFPSMIYAAKWADMFDRYFSFIDLRHINKDGALRSLWVPATLTVECYNLGE